VACAYSPAKDLASDWQQIEETLASSKDLLEELVVDPAHSVLMASADRTSILDHEDSGDDLVLLTQPASHAGTDEWVARVLQQFT